MKTPTLTKDNVADEMMTALRNVSLGDNMSGQIVKVTMPIGQTIEIPHNLKVVPKYRIILRLEGAAIIVDGDKDWTDKAIYLKAVGVPTGVTNPVTQSSAIYFPGDGDGYVNIPANISTLTYTGTEVIVTMLIMRE